MRVKILIVEKNASFCRAVSILESARPRKEGAVDCVDNWLSADLTTTEEAAIKTFNGVFTASDAVEFEVDVALGVGI